MSRVLVIIIDGVGIGALPDASEYGDDESATLQHIAEATGGLHLPVMEKLGLGKIMTINGVRHDGPAQAAYGKMHEVSAGKDSTTGHWELAGLISEKPFPTYPQGFPKSVIRRFKDMTGYEVLGNKPASGTEIIKELGMQHLRTGKPIVYTSADSVFQIAAHQEVISLDHLYDLCQIAREMLQGEHAVSRVIARPFVGDNPDNFKRTVYRKDFSLEPNGSILHLNLKNAGILTVGIGKINDLYALKGITENLYTKSNQEGMETIIKAMHQYQDGFIMANLVDFDMLWGHRNDPRGFYRGLQEFDDWLNQLLSVLKDDDLVIITSDHGNDPTTPSTDHSREYVPVLAFGPTYKKDVNLGIRRTFADLQATVADYFHIESTGWGTSFLPEIKT
ncbi:MAG: phosphopentomutase [Caldithrix sp.]|nr:phosphopentomutase [Caldithrix sp.]